MPKRKYTCNEDFFETPTIENCYFAGFIAADGCIDNTSLRIHLSKTDKSILKDFLGALKSNYKIKDAEGKEFVSPRTGKKCLQKPTSLLVVHSRKIVDDLKKNFNIEPKKSLTLKPPNIYLSSLIKSFMVGLIDGDGCIGVYYRKGRKLPRLSLRICSASYEFISWCKSLLEKEYNLDSKNIIKKQNTLYSVEFQGQKAITIITDLIDFNVPKLDRKWNKAREYFSLKGIA